jgi:hypothetical protein
MPANPLPAEDREDQPKPTMLWIYPHAKRVECVIPADVTSWEAASLGVLLAEIGQSHLLRGWAFEERVEYYGLERFFRDPAVVKE